MLNTYDPLNPGMLDPEHDPRSGCAILIALALGLLLCSLFGSCAGKKSAVSTVTRERVRIVHDTLRTNTIRRDSVYRIDSVFTREIMRGDTLCLTTEKWKVMYRDRLRIDTLWKVRLDTAVRTDTVTVVREVPKPLSGWQRVAMDTGKIILAAAFTVLVAMLLYGIYLLILRVRKKT